MQIRLRAGGRGPLQQPGDDFVPKICRLMAYPFRPGTTGYNVPSFSSSNFRNACRAGKEGRKERRRGSTMLKGWLRYSAVTLLAASNLLAETPARVQTFPLHDAAALITPPKAKIEAVKYQGRKCVRLTIDGDDNDGLALLPGTDFQDGVIEADIALKTT